MLPTWPTALKPPAPPSKKLDEIQQRAAEFKQMQDKPLNNVALTLMEVFPFPIGIGLTLLSAAILRKSNPPPTRFVTSPL